MATGARNSQRIRILLQEAAVQGRVRGIISELLRAGYTTSEIPPDIDKVWEEVIGSETQQEQELEEREEHPSIDARIEQAHQEKFWRYFASHVLYMSLSL